MYLFKFFSFTSHLLASVEDKPMPLVSAECAHIVDAPPEELILFAPYTAACVTVKVSRLVGLLL